jgi:hypothetical protein
MTEEEKKDQTNKQHTDKELKKIAEDLLAGRIFTDRHIPEHTKAHMVFMPLTFMNEDQAKQFQQGINDERIYMLYEYMENAGPRTINGMPIFMSYRVLNREQTEKVLEYYNKIKEAIDKI